MKNQFQKDCETFKNDTVVKALIDAREAMFFIGYTKRVMQLTRDLKAQFRHLKGGKIVMAQFRATIQGQRGEASRLGSKSSGIAALRLIAKPDLRKKLKIDLPQIKSPKNLPSNYRVRIVANRQEARPYIGFKHINGPFKWDALAKANYAAEWLRSGGKIDEISRTLGDNHNTVRRLVNGWFVLQQAKDNGFQLDQISRRKFAFSHLYTALTRSGYRSFLGLSEEVSDAEPKPNPIKMDKTHELLTVMSWLYGQEDKKEPCLIQSQNPDLNRLNEVLLKPEARKMLMAQRNLDKAYEKVVPAVRRFEDSLLSASKYFEDAMGLSPYYDGNLDLLRIVEGMQKTIQNLLLVMQETVKKAIKK